MMLQGDTRSFLLIYLHNVFCLLKIIIIITSSGNLCTEESEVKGNCLVESLGKSSPSTKALALNNQGLEEPSGVNTLTAFIHSFIHSPCLLLLCVYSILGVK